MNDQGNNQQENLFEALEKINRRPDPFEVYTAAELWNDEHTSEQMLSYHLNPDIDVSSRNIVFIDRSAKWIANHFDLGAGKNVGDFGCGPGLYATRLARNGAEVTGIDFSARSIEYANEVAKKEGLSVNYVNMNYLDFETGDTYDLIIMIMCDFCALSPAQRKQLLDKYHSLLKPGGKVLLDVYSLISFASREEEALYELNQLNQFWSPEKYYGFQNTFKYEKENVVLDKYTIIEAGRSRTVYNWLQHFSPESLAEEFGACGLSIAETFANVAGDPFDPEGQEFAVVAVKK